MAARHRNVRVARFLIDHGAHVDISIVGDFGSQDLDAFLYWFIEDRTLVSDAEEMVGLLLSTGCESNFTVTEVSLPFLGYPVPESVINVLLNHSSSSIDEIWIQNYLQFCFRKLVMPMKAYIMSDEFQAIMVRFNLGHGVLQQNGHYLVHEYLHWYHHASPRSRRQLDANHLHTLLRRGWSPYSLSREGCTPTLVAVWYNILPTWFSALMEVNQDIEAIATHSLSSYPSQLRECGFFSSRRKIREKYGSLEAFRAIIISEFAKNGCYITDPGDAGNPKKSKPEINATGVQYSPPSDEAEDMGVRRRKGAAGRVEEIED